MTIEADDMDPQQQHFMTEEDVVMNIEIEFATIEDSMKPCSSPRDENPEDFDMSFIEELQDDPDQYGESWPESVS